MSSQIFDILTLDMTFPDTVYIVGTAPVSTGVHERIPQGALTIALNGAITYDINPNIWMIGDSRFCKTDVWKEYSFQIKNAGYDITPCGIYPGCKPVPLVCNVSIQPMNPWIKTVFKVKTGSKRQDCGPFKKSDGTLRMHGTVAGAAIQLCYYMGVKHVRVAGVSLNGQRHHDGTINKDTNKLGDWPHKDFFDWMIISLQNSGLDIEFIEKPLTQDMPAENMSEIKRLERINTEWSVIPKHTDWILDQGKILPHTVFVVGSGPNGLKHYKDIPESAYVIAVNSAINYLPRKPDMWLCADGMTPSRDWFAKALELSAEGVERVWSCAVSARTMSKPTYRFQLVPNFEDGFRPVPGYFRPDETIAGIGIDLAHRLGAREIVLDGVDMSGAFYADGSPSPGNVDDKHGKIWNCCEALDDEIRWMHEHGIRVYTMSKTELKEPGLWVDNKLPSVALLTMSVNPVYAKHAVFNAAIQRYPSQLLTQYMIYQNGTQPDFNHDLPHRIVQSNVDGKWPELWLHKLMHFFDISTEGVMAIFDEDDYFEPEYLVHAVRALIENPKALVAWSYNNKMIDRHRVKSGKYRSPFGTIVASRDFLFKVAKRLWKKIYKLDYRPNERPPGYGEHNGCQDATYRMMIVEAADGRLVKLHDDFESGERIVLHEGQRWYVEHLNSNTCMKRKDENSIDYWMPHPWYAGTQFEKTRTQNK